MPLFPSIKNKNMAKNLLKVWMADNTVTTDDKTDKIFVLESTRSVDQQFVLDRMAAKNPGLHRETMSASINLYHEVISELVMNGYSVNTDLFRAVPQLKGLAEGNAWNPEKNSIYVSLTQGKKLREEIKDTTVQILGDRQATMYINGTLDAATRSEMDSLVKPYRMLDKAGQKMVRTVIELEMARCKNVVPSLPEE